jgi:hypothetical protein
MLYGEKNNVAALSDGLKIGAKLLLALEIFNFQH